MSSPVEVLNLIEGDLVAAQSDDYGEVFNPSTGQVIAKVPLCDGRDVNQAVESAARAAASASLNFCQ